MKILWVIALLFCALVAVAQGTEDPSKWTMGDIALQAAFIGVMLADRSQTLQIRPEGRKEYFSILLSEQPTHERTNRLFVVYALGHTLVAALLDKPYRSMWQMGFILFEANNVRHNTVLGIEARLHF